ncbi:uncharacterized protein TM35_000062380 [Trypanosoma theileri]|uniref:Uncharacterized protein n=1 Tax=Trypanosoma theileri TaxID=67003 RepID=A0A1X0P3G2_9TRYP|nr:uncharacterized protein TM35_000062380 [Trypanosoma theileri]ORC91233.1 hypothetical protein TM35_000062380 [Trypanosoma theileri]
MKRYENDAKKLQSLGFSKTKSLQALKDTGGNYNLALKTLNQQCEQRAPAPVPVKTEVRKKNPDPETTEVITSTPPKRERKHPCIAQFKTCYFGDRCLLRDYPANTCINYFNGSCLYGEFCTKLHHVDGVDIRADRRPPVRGNTLKLPTGVIVDVSESSGGHVLIGRVVSNPADTDKDFDNNVIEPLPHPGRFNRIQGSEPTYTDPHAPNWQTEQIPSVNAPKPFLEAVKKNSSGQQEESSHPPRILQVVKSQSSPSSTTTSPPPQASLSKPRAKHPCLAQFGSCKYGKECNHSEVDADVCVFFLNGHCNRGSTCLYRHEMGIDCLLPTRPVLQEQSNESLSNNQTMKRLEGRQEKDKMAVVLREEEKEEEAVWEKQPTGVMLSDFLSDVEVNESEAIFQEQNYSQEQYSYQPSDDKELEALMGLLEAFPSAEPYLLLQTLRCANGDVNFVADTLSKLDGFESAEEINAILWEERAKEDTSVQEAGLQSNHECFLTLCTLFPAVETSSIEAVLSRCNGDYAEAYDTLLCSVENLTRRDYGNHWNGNIKPADELRLQKLYAMFPSLPKEVIRSTFGASGSDVTKTSTALNEMIAEFLKFENETTKTTTNNSVSTVPRVSDRSYKTTQEPLPSHLLQPSATREEVQKFCDEVEPELRSMGDWRRVRERAYIINSCRLRVMSQASAAYLRGDGKTAKALSRHGKQLGLEYNRLNRIAMVALERERLTSNPASTLDLHGFHRDEVVEVLRRRVELCVRKKIRRLTIVVGCGHHSRRGYSTIYPAVLQQLQQDPQLKGIVEIKSMKPAFFEVLVTSRKE